MTDLFYLVAAIVCATLATVCGLVGIASLLYTIITGNEEITIRL